MGCLLALAVGVELFGQGPAYMAGAILFGLIGYLAFRRGRKVYRPRR